MRSVYMSHILSGVRYEQHLIVCARGISALTEVLNDCPFSLPATVRDHPQQTLPAQVA